MRLLCGLSLALLVSSQVPQYKSLCEVGDDVAATYLPNGRRYPAVLAALLPSGMVLVNWVDGDENYRVMPQSKLWLADKSSLCFVDTNADERVPTNANANAASTFPEGDLFSDTALFTPAPATSATNTASGTGGGSGGTIRGTSDFSSLPTLNYDMVQFNPPPGPPPINAYTPSVYLAPTPAPPTPKPPTATEKDSEYVFNQKYLRSYNIVLSPANKAFLDSDPTKEEYVPCSLETDYGTREMQSWYGAGCRYKGSVGSLRVCVDERTKQQMGACRKLSIKVDSDKFLDSKQKIFGLKKFLFHGMAVDYSLMSERVAYNSFLDVGVIAPRATHAMVYVNGVYDGLYSVVEDVDDRFTKRHFADDANKGKGAIYKELWFLDALSEKDIKDAHDDGPDETEFLIEVQTALMTVSDTKSDALRVLSKYFDLEQLVDVIAVNTLVGMTDDWRMRHNFFWYVRQDPDTDEKRLVMIPWDYDRLNDGSDRLVAGAPKDWYTLIAPEASLCTQFDPSPQQRALQDGHVPGSIEYKHWEEIYSSLPPRVEIPIQCDKAARVFAFGLKDLVLSRILDLAETGLNENAYFRKMDHYARALQDIIPADTDPPKLDEWKAEVDLLWEHLSSNREKVMANARAGLATPTFLPQMYPTYNNNFGGARNGGDGFLFSGIGDSSSSNPFTGFNAYPSTPTTPASLNLDALSIFSAPPSSSTTPTVPLGSDGMSTGMNSGTRNGLDYGISVGMSNGMSNDISSGSSGSGGVTAITSDSSDYAFLNSLFENPRPVTNNNYFLGSQTASPPSYTQYPQSDANGSTNRYFSSTPLSSLTTTSSSLSQSSLYPSSFATNPASTPTSTYAYASSRPPFPQPSINNYGVSGVAGGILRALG